MSKSVQHKILAAIIAASTFYTPFYAQAANLEITDSNKDNLPAEWVSENSITHKNNSSGNNISINVSGGLKDYTIVGGYSLLNHAENNTVTVTGGTISSVYGGQAGAFFNPESGNGNANGNKITISGNANIYLDVIGGISVNGSTANNSVHLTGSKALAVTGGLSTNSSNSNYVKVDGNSTVTEVYGGSSVNGSAANNKVEIADGAEINTVYGAFSFDNAENNTVTITGGTINDVYGGRTGAQSVEDSSFGDAMDNTVTISGKTKINDNIYGGFSKNGFAASNNVTISDNSTVGYVYGGYSNSLAANGNSVIIKDTVSADAIIGGLSQHSSAINNTVTLNGSVTANVVYGGCVAIKGNSLFNTVTITGDENSKITINDEIIGGISSNGNASGNTVKIKNVNSTNDVLGGSAGSHTEPYRFNDSNASENTVTITNSSVHSVYGGFSENGEASANIVVIDGNAQINGTVFGGNSLKGSANKNIVDIDSATINNSSIYGGQSGNNINGSGDANDNFIRLINVNASQGSVTGGAAFEGSANGNIVDISMSDIGSSVFGGQTTNGDASNNTVAISNDSSVADDIYGGYTEDGSANANIVNISAYNAEYGTVIGGSSATGEVDSNGVSINGGIFQNISGGYSGNSAKVTNNKVAILQGNVRLVKGGYSVNGSVSGNYVQIGTINGVNSDITVDAIYGGHATDKGNADNNIVILNSGTARMIIGGQANNSANGNNIYLNGGTVTGVVAGASSQNSTNNAITISGSADVSGADIYGSYNNSGSGNTLTINGWSGKTNSAKNFSDINFENIKWQNGGTVLKITAGGTDNLKDTNINLNSIAGGSKIAVGDTMTFISSNADLTGVNYKTDNNFTAGVALEGEGTASVDSEGNVKFTVNGLKTSGQTELVAQTRAASAAFVNQGTDLISDSLDTISRDSNYGIKTFAAVHGNKSKYDVNSDIKINGWSTIVGVGNAAEFTDGDNFSWGVFYENGSGNYRTYNSFNNEFFRGDGSLVYNGGGIAARYENNSGMYTEGSLRAGMLKSDMDNALRDASGNNYGYESESAYYGAHIGVGKIIGLSESSDLDVYGKFFHTYVEGDSFNVAGDKFEFDSINSDRLRIGARVTTNKENKFSTYYGLAYEYEFNGDADMKAQGINAPTQSLQGSSYMAELGLNYQPTPDSPWSFDLNLRGYTGERQGGSFNVQATYTF